MRGRARPAFIRTKWTLGLGGGVVISNPVPALDAMPCPRPRSTRSPQQALAEAAAQGVVGQGGSHPFCSARIKALTEGRSLATNIALVKHNAHAGAMLAWRGPCGTESEKRAGR